VRQFFFYVILEDRWVMILKDFEVRNSIESFRTLGSKIDFEVRI